MRELTKGTDGFSPRVPFPARLLLLGMITAFPMSVPVRAQESVFHLDPAETHIEITLAAILHTVHGTFRLKSGEIRFDPASGIAGGSIIVDATSGDTNNRGRDKRMHQEVLESPKYAEIEFIPVRMKGSVTTQGPSQVEVSGIMRLHGQEHELALAITLQRAANGELQASMHFAVPYVKWGLKNPSTFFLRVNDTVEVDVRATGRLIPEPTR